jgi:beta-phosphoglucomutase
MKVKGLLFDLDGVLVSTEKNHFLAWRNTAQALGIDFNEEDNEHLKGVSRIESLKKILALGNLSISEEKFNELLVFKNKSYLDSIKNLSKNELLPGVLDLLEEAAKINLPLGVGSSSKNAVFILEKLQITNYFKVIIDGNLVKNPKPHPEVFINGSSLLGIVPKDCMVFEDAYSGVAAAKSGGFIVVGVGNPAVKSYSDMYFNNLTEFNLSQYV